MLAIVLATLQPGAAQAGHDHPAPPAGWGWSLDSSVLVPGKPREAYGRPTSVHVFAHWTLSRTPPP